MVRRKKVVQMEALRREHVASAEACGGGRIANGAESQMAAFCGCRRAVVRTVLFAYPQGRRPWSTFVGLSRVCWTGASGQDCVR